MKTKNIDLTNQIKQLESQLNNLKLELQNNKSNNKGNINIKILLENLYNRLKIFYSILTKLNYN